MLGQWDYWWNHQQHTIYFSFDEVKPSPNLKRATFIEHKMPSELGHDEDVIEHEMKVQRYLEKSFCQVALFQSLFHYSSRWLRPSSFSKETVNLNLKDTRTCFKLNFGGSPYFVRVINPDQVLRFYLTKLRAAFHWDKSARFDESWKHKEWDWMKEHVKVRR